MIWSKNYRHFERAFKKEIAIKRLSRRSKERLVCARSLGKRPRTGKKR